MAASNGIIDITKLDDRIETYRAAAETGLSGLSSTISTLDTDLGSCATVYTEAATLMSTGWKDDDGQKEMAVVVLMGDATKRLQSNGVGNTLMKCVDKMQETYDFIKEIYDEYKDIDKEHEAALSFKKEEYGPDYEADGVTKKHHRNDQDKIDAFNKKAETFNKKMEHYNTESASRLDAIKSGMGGLSLGIVGNIKQGGSLGPVVDFSYDREDKAYVPEPEVSEPDTSEPNTSEPVTSEPQVSEPNTSEPETSEPNTSEPNTSEPETSEPNTSEPETSEPNRTTPLESQDVEVPKLISTDDTVTIDGQQYKLLANMGGKNVYVLASEDNMIPSKCYYLDENKQLKEAKVSSSWTTRAAYYTVEIPGEDSYRVPTPFGALWGAGDMDKMQGYGPADEGVEFVNDPHYHYGRMDVNNATEITNSSAEHSDVVSTSQLNIAVANHENIVIPPGAKLSYDGYFGDTWLGKFLGAADTVNIKSDEPIYLAWDNDTGKYYLADNTGLYATSSMGLEPDIIMNDTSGISWS